MRQKNSLSTHSYFDPPGIGGDTGGGWSSGGGSGGDW